MCVAIICYHEMRTSADPLNGAGGTSSHKGRMFGLARWLCGEAQEKFQSDLLFKEINCTI